jgi:hypothetical protein
LKKQPKQNHQRQLVLAVLLFFKKKTNVSLRMRLKNRQKQPVFAVFLEKQPKQGKQTRNLYSNGTFYAIEHSQANIWQQERQRQAAYSKRISKLNVAHNASLKRFVVMVHSMAGNVLDSAIP